MAFDIKLDVTDRIIRAIEDGKMARGHLWSNAGGGTAMPINYRTKRPYSGVNVLLLWIEGMESGFERQEWLTYKQAQEIGANVRNGAKGCHVVFFKTVEKDSKGEEATKERERFPMLRSFVVFNVADIDGLPEVSASTGGFEPHAIAENILQASGAEIIESSTCSFYQPATDTVHLPDRERFNNAANFYHVSLHELTHWSGSEKRLAREFSGRFGDESYAFEELVAELGSAFMLARIGLHDSQLEFHASYLNSWLRVLKSDKGAIFTAANRANEAYQYLLTLAGISTAENIDYAKLA